jgi:hypothetical protein
MEQRSHQAKPTEHGTTTRYNNTAQDGTTTRYSNTAQQHGTDKLTSHLRRKQDQLPIILNKFSTY